MKALNYKNVKLLKKRKQRYLVTSKIIPAFIKDGELIIEHRVIVGEDRKIKFIIWNGKIEL